MPAAIASVGMSSTADRQRAYHSRSPGLQGASAKPQLPITTDVTPCQHEQLPSGSQATCASMWVWPSMKPGATISPSASIVRRAAPATLPISTMRPSLIATSAPKRGPTGTVDDGAAADDEIERHHSRSLCSTSLPVGVLGADLAAAERVDVAALVVQLLAVGALALTVHTEIARLPA